MQPFFRAVSLLLLSTPLLAQSASPVTHVLATLSIKEGTVREQFTKVMPQEVRSTVQLYLDGRIEQWYARADGKGVIFVMNCKSVAEAKELLEQLPLVKEKLASFDYVPLSPLTPLRILMAPAAQ